MTRFLRCVEYVVLFFFVSVGHAHAFSAELSIEEIESITPILQSYTVISVIIVSVITIATVLRSARLMRGGVFGGVLWFFGIGMTMVFAGFLSDSYDILPFQDAGVINHTLFILGFLSMAYAATKLSKAIEG